MALVDASTRKNCFRAVNGSALDGWRFAGHGSQMRRPAIIGRLLGYLMVSLLAALPAHAEDVFVDVELVLAVDVSRSMSPRELEIQRRGYAAALSDPSVIQAIQEGPNGRVALIYVEWAGWNSQRVIVPWTMVATPEDARGFAKRLTARFDPSLRRTSISGLLDYAGGLFEANGFRSLRRVIDISGDGPNNHGRPVEPARDDVLAKGIAINGLPLMTREGMGWQWHLDDLDEYYRHCVIGGPSAFVIPVLEWAHFPEAVRRKLILELVGLPAGPGTGPVRRAAGYDCMIGEKIWDRLMDDWN